MIYKVKKPQHCEYDIIKFTKSVKLLPSLLLMFQSMYFVIDQLHGGLGERKISLTSGLAHRVQFQILKENQTEENPKV